MARNYFFNILCVVALLLGGVPLLITFFFHDQIPSSILLSLNFAGWTGFGYLFFSRRKVLRSVQESLEAMGLPLVPGDFEEKLKGFVRESQRYYRAAYAFRADKRLSKSQVGNKLRQIIELVYREVDAQAVLLALFEEKSGQASQALMVGIPRYVTSQEMLHEKTNGTEESTLQVHGENTHLLIQPLYFAGTTFGKLWVEMKQGVKPTKSDIQVIELLARQGALMLIDARFTDELLRMRRVSEESVRAKTGFLANLSHEIRGPLGIILNGAELMVDGLCGPTSESQRETLEMIKSSGEHLLDLVNDVLDYAKVEAGNVIAKPVPIELKSFLEDMATVVRTQAVAKQHLLRLEPVDETLGMLCDKRHSRQMLINILTNAIKYTPEGGKITIKAERIAEKKVKLSVNDTGVGIAQSERIKVFSAFERVENQYSMSQVGTGLGMPLSLKLAEVNGGTVNFESEEGKGSTFWMVMPLVEIESSRALSEASGEMEQQGLQGREELVLLVDCDKKTREMVGRYLNHQGFKILDAASGPDVLKALRENSLHAAIVENDIPGLPGEDVVTLIRANLKAGLVPIILLSSRAFVFDIERFLKLGVDRCLSKPVELAKLASTLRRLIDESQSLRGKAPSLPLSLEATPPN